MTEYNQTVWEVFSIISSQVRVSNGVILGLDYNVLFKILDTFGIDKDEHEYIIRLISILESRMIERYNKKMSEKSKNTEQCSNLLVDDTVTSRR